MSDTQESDNDGVLLASRLKGLVEELTRDLKALMEKKQNPAN